MTSATQTASAPLTIRVNDEPRVLPGATTLLDLARHLGVAERKGVAIAINDSVVARTAWPAHALTNGDRVLVIRATQGG
jgi:sulfur carrier protein